MAPMHNETSHIWQRVTARMDVLEHLPAMVLSASILALPWLFGGVYASTQWLLAASIALTLLLFLVCRNSEYPSISVGLIPLLLAVSWGFCQQLPVGENVLEVVARTNANHWKALAPASNGEAVGMTGESQLAAAVGYWPVRHHRPVSLYPAATRHDLAMLLLAASIFFLGNQLFAHTKPLLVLSACVAANGAAFAVFGMAQQLVWSGKIYGVAPLLNGGAPFAAYVNRNNAAGWLGLALGCAVGFSLWVFSPGVRRHRSSTLRDVSAMSRVRRGAMTFLAQLDGRRVFALLLLLVILAGLFACLSRGGWISALCAIAVIGLVLRVTRRANNIVWVVPFALLSAYFLVSWLGHGESVRGELASLRSEVIQPRDARLAHWRDGLTAGQDFWLAGSGLGTYRYIYRPYVREAEQRWFYHAENQYLEAFVEGGVIGLGLLAAAILIMAFSCRRLLLEAVGSDEFTCGILGAFVLTNQLVHACFDFGLYLPANMALFALLCGGVAGNAARLQAVRPRMAARRLGARSNGRLSCSLAAALACLVVVGMFELRSVAAIESALRDSRDTDVTTLRSAEATTAHIQRLGAAVAERPDDAEARLRLAELLVERYQTRATVSLRQQNPQNVSDTVLRRLTSPMALHGTVWELRRRDETLELDNLRRSHMVQVNLLHAARHLLHASSACPLLPRAHLLLAKIGPAVSPHAVDELALARMRRIVGGQQTLITESGFLELQAGRTTNALVDLKRSAQLAPEKLRSMLLLVSGYLDAECVADVVPDSPVLLVELANELFTEESQTAIRRALLERAEQLLTAQAVAETDALYIRGMIHRLRSEDAVAIDMISRAVADRPEEVAWRYELAVLLQSSGDVEQAREHAKICVRMEPQNDRFDALLKELIRARLTSG